MSIATQYSLQNIENYKSTFTNTYQEIQVKYNSLVSEYLFFILENIIFIFALSFYFFPFILWYIFTK